MGLNFAIRNGDGSAVLAVAIPEVGIGYLGVALAFGLTVMTMAFAVGGVSGGHFNPAVSLGPALAGRFDAKNLVRYWAVQVAGAIIVAACFTSSRRARPALSRAVSRRTVLATSRPAAMGLWPLC